MFSANRSSRVIVSFVSFSNVGNTAKVCASALLTAAVVANVVSLLVIRLRSVAGSWPIAPNTVPPFRTSRTTEPCSTSSTRRMSVESAANVGRLPSTLLRF